jgi:hypothetical protein
VIGKQVAPSALHRCNAARRKSPRESTGRISHRSLGFVSQHLALFAIL